MSEVELQAQVDAAYAIARISDASVRNLARSLGEAEAKALWTVTWIVGYRAGLQVARDAIGESRR